MLVDVERPIHVRVRAFDEYGDALTIEASGLEARVIQHEMDHLDGVLILERTSRDERKQAMRILREEARGAAPLGVASEMRTVYLGTSDFAAAVLDRLAGGPHRPALVISRPDSRAGRGRALTPPPVAVRARELGIELIQPERLHEPEVLERIAAAAPDALVVCAFGVLIKEPLLSDYEIFNVHPSLLPRWRGAAPVERAIMAGDAETGVSIMRLTAGLDSGPVCLQEREPIRPDDDYGTLSARLRELGGDAARPRARRAAALRRAGRGAA